MQSVSIYAQHLFETFSKLPLLTQWAVVFLLVVGFIVQVFAYNQRTVAEGPSIFTTAGIFFTFVGIAEGLIGFNAQDVEASIPSLLSGLQTAFIASVVGVGIALSIKLRYTLFGLRASKSDQPVQDASIDDLYAQLRALNRALVGDEESTVVSQLKLGRQDTNDRLDALHRSQTEFLERMADNNSRALIHALQEVIRDFNTKISEQFGENFKQLNLAVGQLLVWQQNYRDQLAELVTQQTATAETMKEASQHYQSLVTKSETFTTVSKDLSSIIGALNTQRSHLEQSLQSLGELLVTASSGLPKLEAKFIDLTSQFSNGVQESNTQIQRTLNDGSQALRKTVDEVKQLLLTATESTNREVNAHFRQLGDRTTEQINTLDIALERELTTALKSLAGQLTSLSEKFVADYGPLTERLREIVQLGRARA